MKNLTSFRLAAVVMAAALLAISASGQTKAQEQKWRTPWGDPDLQGSWSNATTTPLQRPAKYGNREFMSKEEIAEVNKQTSVGTDEAPREGDTGTYNQFWWERGWSDGRTSLIYDPPDGHIPALTPEAQKRKAALPDLRNVFDGPEDFSYYVRCIIRAPLPRVSTGYDNNYQIVQAPGMVAILQEQIHEVRVIPIDGRPHLNSSVRQYLGDSRGHWEGNTLVVETTNFRPDATFGDGNQEGIATKDMVLVERWTRISDDRIDYHFTVTDPATWTKPWSAAVNWNKTGMLYEYACHEDNYSLYGILSGARTEEKQAKQEGAQKPAGGDAAKAAE